MSKEYRYNTAYFSNTLSLSALTSYVGLIFLGAAIMTPGAITSPFIWSLPTLFLLLGAGFAYEPYRLAGMSFVITEDAVVRRSRWGVMSFPLEDVKLVFRLGSLRLQYRSGKCICDLFWLRDFRGFFSELKERLDARHLSGNYEALDMSQWPSQADRQEAIGKCWEVVNTFYRPMGVVLLNLAGTLILGVAIGTHGWEKASSSMCAVPLLWYFFLIITLQGSVTELIRQQQADPVGRITLDREYVTKRVFRSLTWGSVGYFVVVVAGVAAAYFKAVGVVGQ